MSKKYVLLAALVLSLTACATDTKAETPSQTPTETNASLGESSAQSSAKRSVSIPGFTYDLPESWSKATDVLSSSDLSEDPIVYGRFFEYTAPEQLSILKDIQSNTEMTAEEKRNTFLEKVRPFRKAIAGFYVVDKSKAEVNPTTDTIKHGYTELTVVGEDDGHYYLFAKGPMVPEGLSETSITQYQALMADADQLLTQITAVPETLADVARMHLTKDAILDLASEDFNGNSFTNANYKDAKITMVNFWATWCGYCVEELPILGDLAASYDAKDFQIVGVLTDGYEDAPDTIEKAKAMLTASQADYTNLKLSTSIAQRYAPLLKVMPTTVFVNAEGTILDDPLEGVLTIEGYKEKVDALLKP